MSSRINLESRGARAEPSTLDKAHKPYPQVKKDP